MKIHIKIIFAWIMCLVSLNSCNDKLELDNPNLSPVESFLTTNAQVQAAVNAVYANLQTRGLYSRHMFFSMDNMGHENEGNPQLEADKRQYLEFTFDASHGAIRAFWESCYRGINKANYVLDNQDKINEIPEGQLSEAARNNYYGQVKFLRAFYYFLLVTRYGSVPLVTSVPETGDGTPKSSTAEVYQQIISDLEDAASMLYEKTNTNFQKGRASQGAAYALLGKVYLYMEEYQKAKDAFENVLGKYALVEDYRENFVEEKEHNNESIFEVEYDENLGVADVWNSDASGAGLNEATFRGQEYGWADWFNVYPSNDLLDAYEDGDPRFAANFYTDGDTWAGGTTIRTGEAPKPVPEDESYIPLERVAAWKKYQNYYKESTENTYSSINFRVIRYADVLLMMAEVENELNHPDEAIDYLNQVRDRVGMPEYGTPEMDAIYPVGSKAEIFDAIVHERQVELAGEQSRFPDLVRWGLAEEVLGKYGFKAGKNELFPIPQNEINSNNALSNKDQNPGY